MSLVGKELKKEKEYLTFVKDMVDKKIKKLKDTNEELNKSITTEQKELWNNMSGMDVAEIEFASSDIERTYLQAKYFYQNLTKYQKVYGNPYFGRIDFQTNKESTKVYIGLSSVSDDEYNNYVYDWRAPISSLYYDYELGKAKYEAPEGIIEGSINLKRQYKIENGKMLYAFDSTVSIQDEMLQEALSNNSQEKMKDIVTTIQKEQNEVIRNTSVDNLIVEGAAGSGKTSVALHRIAFILYRYRNYVNNKNIVIFSPNKVFSEYISDVLPSLGEENVKAIIFNELLEANLNYDEYETIENYQDLIERFHNTKSKIEKRILEIKMNNEFINVVDKYLERIIKNIKFKDIIVNDELLLSKEECIEDFNNTYSRYKPYIKIEKIINNVTTKYKNTHIKKAPKYTSTIKNSIQYEKNINKIIENMYYDIEFLEDVNKNYNIDKKTFQEFCLKELKTKDIKYYDAIIYLYIKAKLQGINNRTDIKYVIVDEAQDYNLMQYYLIKEYYNKAKFTILGDPNQAITTMVNYQTMDKIKDIIKGNVKLLKLLTTYRSSYEITDFCNKILNLNHVHMINRHSQTPKIMHTKNLKETIENLIQETINKGLESVAILCENNDEKKMLEKLIKKQDIKTYILPVYEAKGLEFDSVIIYDNGFSKLDKKLYYVACTRALHMLNIITNN